jgi:hypothetical protein
MAAFSRDSSFIISSSICSRPAVSTMTTRSRARFAWSIPCLAMRTTSWVVRSA